MSHRKTATTDRLPSVDATIKTNADGLAASAVAGFMLVPTVPAGTSIDRISVGGRVIGELKTHTDLISHGSRCHACIDLVAVVGQGAPLGELRGGGSLAQGFGDTPEEALADAILRGRRFAIEYAAALEQAAGLVGIAPAAGGAS